MGKKVLATTSLAGCFGCHMSVLDIDERILELINLVEFNKSPIDDIKSNYAFSVSSHSFSLLYPYL